MHVCSESFSYYSSNLGTHLLRAGTLFSYLVSLNQVGLSLVATSQPEGRWSIV